MSQSAVDAGRDVPADPAVSATVRADRLQAVLGAANALVDECRLRLGPDGLGVTAADPASVALVQCSLPAAACESYDADGETVGVDLERLRDVVGMGASDERVRLLFDAETRRLHVLLSELSYTLGLVDPAAVREPPEIDRSAYDHTAAATVVGEQVDRFVDAAGMVADHLALGVDPEASTFYVAAEGDTDDVSLRLGGDDLVDVDPGAAHSLFSLDYLREMARPIPGEAKVTLRLGTELPVELSFAAADGAVDVEYLLSPRLVRD